VINNVRVELRDPRIRATTAGRGQVAGSCAPAGCSFDIECDDGDPCTLDDCNVPAGEGPGTGTCTHDPVREGLPGDCDDGLFCNGRETCQGSPPQCTAGVSAQCCDDPGFLLFCTEVAARCVGGGNDGATCSSNAQCPGGTCDHCQPACASADDCNDGVNCNGVEQCVDVDPGASVSLRCVPGQNPCGAAAFCTEGQCSEGVAPPTPCNSDADCVGECVRTAALCQKGRCCVPFTDDGGEWCQEFPSGCACWHGRLADCANISAQSQWYPGDGGRLEPVDQIDKCGGSDESSPSTPIDAWGCPKYGRGITMHDSASQPGYPVLIGPISNAPAAAGPVPPNGPDGELYALGDDYTLAGSAYVGLDVLRWVGGMTVRGRLIIEFYDSGGAFIGDALTPYMSSGIGYQVLKFTPSLIIPPTGWVAMRVATEYSPNARFVWLSTTTANGVQGTNDAGQLWVNTGPANATWLGPNSQILALELVGDDSPAPAGACCNRATGACEENVLSWTCHDQRGSFGPGATCVDFMECQTGACCDAATGACAVTNKGGCSGSFQGYGTGCDPSCCPQPMSLRCMGGPNNDSSCSAGADCGRCRDGTNAGLPCAQDADCPGSACDGQCVVRGTGADNCADAGVLVITVPNPGEPAHWVTISGDNSAASASVLHPDSCFGTAGDLLSDAGWWEGFEIATCANVRIDLCCSAPIRHSVNEVLYHECQCSQVVHPRFDPLVVPPSSGFGPPICEEDNFWATYSALPEGRYYYTIRSTLTDVRGAYQMHITVTGCPVTACCYLECSATAQPCNPDNPCPEGETCDSKCAELNQLACNAKLGFSLQPPQVHDENVAVLCTTGLCDSGSCCVGPGLCKDNRNNDGDPMLRSVCEGPGFEGTFIGGVQCKGGRCDSGPYMGLSCNDVDDGYTCDVVPPDLQACNCAGVGACTGDVAQAGPCPLCEVESPTNCQLFNDGPLATASDSSFAGHVSADDFIHGGGSIDKICVWGVYYDTDPAAPATDHDCGNEVASDRFTVRFFHNDTSLPGTPGLPGAMVVGSERKIDLTGNWPSLTRPRATVPGTSSLATFEADVYSFQLTLSPPVTGLLPNTCYWIEVSNDTGPTPEQCHWAWSRLDPDGARGNDHAAAGDFAAGYGPGSERQWDHAFCLNTPFGAGGCGVAERACCTCGGMCSTKTLDDCDAAGAQWNVNNDSCDAFTCPGPPPNDDCAEAIDVPVGSYSTNTNCATTDGVPFCPNLCYDVGDDLWFRYEILPNVPGGHCDLTASMCGSGSGVDETGYDAALAVYSDCDCETATTSGNNLIGYGDDTCYGNQAAGGAGHVELPDREPGCYLIRVGGWNDNEHGVGSVSITCGPPYCGDGRHQASYKVCSGDAGRACADNNNCTGAGTCITKAESCDGADSAACPVGWGCNPDCTCGQACVTCGDGIISPNEECDPNAAPTGCTLPAVCRPPNDLQCCTCVPFCGNNVVESTGEDCDGTAGTCPSAGACQSDCTCPPIVCGNGVLEPGEECESDDDCGGAICRAPGDPLSGCTCTCLACPILPSPIWDSNISQSRSLSFRVVTPSTATGGGAKLAIKVLMVELHDPWPPNNNPPGPCCPPGSFVTFDTTMNSVCSGGPNQGYFCTVPADCPGSTCPPPQGCTAVGEANECVRWVGPPLGYLESNDNPALGNYRVSRLQCAPYYHDWSTEPNGGWVNVIGAEIVPSSTYEVTTSLSGGPATSCTGESETITVTTRRAGDISTPYQGAPPLTQPNAVDVANAVNKFRNLAGSPPKVVSQVQPNFPDPNADINAIDIVTVVDNQRGFGYTYSGPCVCPSTVPCNTTACAGASACTGLYGAGATCIKTCTSGRTGQPCNNNLNCGYCVGGPVTGAGAAGIPCDANGDCASGTCQTGVCPTGATPGFCRDRCGRCN
jgi:hypothetical protein